MAETAGRLRFGLLGPLEAVDGDRVCTPTAPRLRTLLALLLVRANTVVSHAELVEELWEANPPPAAQNTLQAFVGRLRRCLTPGRGPRDPDQILRTTAAGYSLRVTPDQLDVARFERCVADGRRAMTAGDPDDAAEALRTALALWRGPALADVPAGSLLTTQGQVLEEARLAALEHRIEADLHGDRLPDLVPELRTLTARHPLREAFWRQLMVALYRSGRQAEALDAYQRLRTWLVAELGVEPGPGVRRAQQAILLGDPALTPESPGENPTGPPVVAQLPARISDFTGRTELVARLCGVLRHEPPDHGAGRLAVISGKAGGGKTTLAVHVAHRCRDAYPDGQLYANLRGAAGPPAAATDVLARFLRALGVGGAAIPETLEERAELYRSRLADRRVLVVLDDAAEEGQVRPLIPGGPGCAVLVTGRGRLPGLEGAVAVDLPLFAPGEAIDLLGRLAGDQRVAADPPAAVQLTELCGLLPLAVRVAGAKLAAKPHWSVAGLAQRLAGEHTRLGELRAGDLDVRASFALSYQACGPAERRAFRLLAGVPAPEFPAWVAAAACGTGTAVAESVLERLVDVQLLQVVGRDRTGQVRYQYHDLLRVYAAERLAVEETADQRRTALLRVLGAYRELARRADAALQPGRPGPAGSALPPECRWEPDPDLGTLVARNPVRWYAAERAALVAAVTQAHAAGAWELCWSTAQATVGFFDLRSYWDDWRRVAELAGDAARRAGDRAAAASARYDLGLLYVDQGRLADAYRALTGCLAEYERLGRRRDAAYTRCHLAMLLVDERRLAEALAEAAKCLTVFAECGDRRGEAFACRAMGTALRYQGRLTDAAGYLDRSLGLFRTLGDRRWEAYLLLARAGVRESLGDAERAAADVDGCLEILRSLDDRRWEAFALRTLGDVRRRQRRFDAAAACYRRALAIMRRLGDRRSEGHLARNLGDLYRIQGRLPAARALLERSLEIFREFRDQRGRPLALLGLGAVAREEARYAEAAALAEQSLALVRGLSLPLWEARALTDLGETLAATGDPSAARHHWHQARTLFRQIGSPEADHVTTLLTALPTRARDLEALGGGFPA